MKFLKEKSNEEIEQYKKFFKENEYLLIKDILTPECIEYFKKIKFKDKPEYAQFGRLQNIEFPSKVCPIIEKYHKKTLNFFQQIIGKEYFDTYYLAMDYIYGSELLPHLDMVTNEVSCTTCYETNIEHPIFLCKKFYENNYNDRYTTQDPEDIKDSVEINVKCGDIGMFNGRNYLHWRKKITKKDASYKGVLTHYSKTVKNSKEWFKKTSESVPYKYCSDANY